MRKIKYKRKLQQFSKYTNSEEKHKKDTGNITFSWQLAEESFTNGALCDPHIFSLLQTIH